MNKIYGVESVESIIWVQKIKQRELLCFKIKNTITKYQINSRTRSI